MLRHGGSQTCAVEGAYALRTSRQERRGVLEFQCTAKGELFMGRVGKVYIQNHYAGTVEETDTGYSFRYDKTYLEMENAVAVSLTLPMREEPYESKVLFPFFDGLIPEGWLLEVVTRNWKISYKDRFGLLLIACRDCIGDVAVEAADHGDSESAN